MTNWRKTETNGSCSYLASTALVDHRYKGQKKRRIKRRNIKYC